MSSELIYTISPRQFHTKLVYKSISWDICLQYRLYYFLRCEHIPFWKPFPKSTINLVPDCSQNERIVDTHAEQQQ